MAEVITDGIPATTTTRNWSAQCPAIAVGALLLAQWPLAAIAGKLTSFHRPTNIDVLTVAIVLGAVLCLWNARKQFGRNGGVLLLIGCLLMSLAQVVAFRDSRLVVSFALCGIVWLYGAVCLFALGLKPLSLMAVATAAILGSAVLVELGLTVKAWVHGQCPSVDRALLAKRRQTLESPRGEHRSTFHRSRFRRRLSHGF
jgi:hypothetical protein